MAQSFDSWYRAASLPWESLQEAEERYEQFYGVKVQREDDQEEEGEDWLDRYAEREAERERQEKFISDPDLIDQFSAGIDDAQASGGSALAGPISGFLSDYVSEDLGQYVKEYGEDVRDRNLAESALVAQPKSREEILREDPNSFYKYLPEDTPTGSQIVRQTPTSLAAAGIALPAALAGGYVAGAAGLAGLGTMAVGGATGMLVGNAASSLQVAGESYERAKNDPLIRQELGIDPNKDFKDLSPEDQKTMDRFATDLSQNAFGHRIYTSGAVEMVSYIPYGGVLARYIADTGLGTASEVWDRSLFTEDAADTLVEYGMPKEKAQEFQRKILDAGPGLWETFWPALVQEGITGGVFTGVETAVTTDHRVNSFATSTKFQNERQLEARKDLEKGLEKEAQADRIAQRAGFVNDASRIEAEGARKILLKQDADDLKAEQQRRKRQQLADQEEAESFNEEFDKQRKIFEDRQKQENDLRKEQREEEIAKLREEGEQRVRERQDVVNKQDAETKQIRDLRYLKENSPLENTKKDLKDKPENIEIKRILSIDPEERRGEDLVELRNYKLKYGLQGVSEDLLLGTDPDPNAPLRTSEEIKKANEKRDKKILKERKEANKEGKVDFLRYAKNPNPKKATLFEKAKQIAGFTAKKDDAKSDFTISKAVMKEVTDGFEKRFKNYKGMFKIVDSTDLETLAQDFTDGQRKSVEDGARNETFSLKENKIFAQEALDTGRGWTFKIKDETKIYLNADQIKGKTNKEISDQIVQIGLFHEPIAHVGLKGYLGKNFNGFLDNYYKTNKSEINKWTMSTVDDSGQAVYLDKGQDIKNIPQEKQRELAEEYLANVFVEFGVRDPNIIARMADGLTRGTLSVFGKNRITTVQARGILAEIQREYLGGKRNIITGDFFDESNWLKPKKDTQSEDKKEEKPEIMKPIAVDRRTLAPTFQAALPAPSGVRFAKRISTPEKRKLWKRLNPANPVKEIKRRDKDLTKLAQKLERGDIEFEQYRTEYEKKFPIRTFNKVPKLSSGSEIAGAINQRQYDEGKLIGEDSDLKKGMDSLVRFDVNSMENYNVGVVTATSPQAKGSHYGKAAHIISKKDGTPVQMVTKNLKNVLGIAAGKGKFPMAFFKGQWAGTSAPEIKKLAEKLLNNPNWIQVGMEPKRQSSFYARETKDINGRTIEAGTPLDTAEEVLQVGMFALAKNPTTKAVPEFMSREGVSVRFAKQALSNQEIAKEYSLPISKNIKDSLPDGAVMLSPIGKIEYIKTTESGSLLGTVRFSKSRFLNNLDAKTSKELQKKLMGKNIVTLVGDRLKRGKYVPIHADKSINSDKMKMLHGGPEYAFDLDNIGTKGRGAWASGEGRITVIANALKELETNIGAIIVGSAEQHMSNMDFWNVMWGETLDASKLGTFDKDGNLKKDKDGNIKKLDINWLNSFVAGKGKLNTDGTLQKNTQPLIELTYKTKEPDPKDKTKEITVINDLIPKKLKSKVTDFNSLMSLGEQLPFKSRKEILVKLFGDPSEDTVKDIMSKANGIDITEIVRRTSAYPDSQVGDAVGLVEFDLDKNGEAIVGNAKEMDIPPHPSYPTVIMGKAIAKYKYAIPMETWARDWLTSTKRYDKKGETGQRAFFPNKKQKKFQKTYFYTTNYLNYKRGFSKTKPSKEYTGEKSAGEVRALAKRVLEMAPGQRELRVTKGMFPTRFSKKKSQPTAAELEAEFRKKSIKVKPDTKIPEDKVTLGNKKDAGGLYTREAVKGLTGEKTLRFSKKKPTRDVVRIAKIYQRSAGAHAIATRSWNPLAKPLTKLGEKYQNLPVFLGKTPQEFSDMLTKYLVAQGTLPDSDKYKAVRRETKGKILKAEEAGRVLYDILKNTEQSDVIFNYFTTKDADPNAITNITERNAAIKAKKEIDVIGRELVQRGLMREKTRKSFEGQYLPRAYMSHLLGESEFKKAITRGGVGTDFKYLKERKDIPKGVRKLIMGEIQDPAYLASRATTIPVKDLAILDWLDNIATNKNWVVPKTMVKFDTLGTLAELAKENKLSQSIIDSVDLKDTDGVNVSGLWLSKEASRIGEMMNFMDLSEGERTTLTSLIGKMKKASESALGASIDDKLYQKIPDTPKYGMLGGMAVRKEIYNDIFAGMEVTTGDISTVEKFVGDGSVVQKFGRIWKWAKVPANPPSWIRNFSSNLILMQMGGMRVRDMPGLLVNGIKDMRGYGEHKGQLYQLAKDLGLTAGGFSQAELGRMQSEFTKLAQKQKKQDDPNSLNMIGDIKNVLFKFMDATTDFYGGIDSLGKMMMIKNELDKRGLKVKDLSEYKGAEKQTLDDAALNAEKWLFDYSNVKQSVRYLRNAPFGAPFMSFTSLVAPLMVETVITKPWKFAPYYAFGWLMKEWFKDNNDIDEEQLEALKLGLSEYLKEKADGIGPAPVVPLPYLDQNGRVQFLDISYLYPWGMFSEMIGEISRGELVDAVKTLGLFGSPVNNVVSAITTGQDPFSRKPIVDETGTPKEKFADILWYAFNLSMPSFLHGAGPGNEGFGAARRISDAITGKIDKTGEPKFTLTQSIARAGGFNVSPLAVPEGRNKKMRFEYSQLLKLQRVAQRDIQNMYIMREPKDEIEEKIQDYKEKIQKKADELKEKIKKSVPPKQLIKAREAFLRENKRKAEEYKASL